MSLSTYMDFGLLLSTLTVSFICFVQQNARKNTKHVPVHSWLSSSNLEQHVLVDPRGSCMFSLVLQKRDMANQTLQGLSTPLFLWGYLWICPSSSDTCWMETELFWRRSLNIYKRHGLICVLSDLLRWRGVLRCSWFLLWSKVVVVVWILPLPTGLQEQFAGLPIPPL